MFELFKAEFIRYRKWAILFLILQIAFWSFLTRLKPLLQPSGEQTALITFVCVAIGLGFGIVQMVLNRRKNNWTYLIQRPLKLNSIYQALASAALVNLIIAIPLGWFLTVTVMDLFTETVVDMRHYLYALYMAGLSITAYFIGTLTVLSASKGAIGLVYFLVIWIFPKPDSLLVLFSLMAGVLALLYYLNLQCFKPDLSTHVTRPLFVVLMGIPMQVTLLFVIIIGSTVYYHIPRFIIGDHPDNNPVVNSLSYLWHIDDPKVVGYILKDHDSIKNKESISRQAELADADYISSGYWTYPSVGQLYTRDTAYGLFDSANRTHWIFSHDDMMLKGVDSLSRRAKGWIGKNGFIETRQPTADDRFESVPFMVADKFLATKTTVFQVNYEDKEMIVKYQTKPGEYFANPPQIRDHFVALVSEQNTYLFDKEDFVGEMIEANPNYTIPHPIALNKIRNMETRRMVDGYLVLYFSRDYNGYLKSAVSINYARLGKAVEMIAKTDYPEIRHPAVILDIEYVASPGAYILYKSIYRILEPSEKDNLSVSEILNREYWPSVQWTSLFLQLFSMIALFMLARRQKLSMALTVIWTVMGATFSLAACASYLLMNRMRAN
ncbi:hypothetical protein QGN29_09275 [Temperatibacter marinus]|uniref:ABC-2 family transporter protein n=1 Tax=Temperatibacter marinus TaxID=1456591 RepID=A0AA52EER9_9PROT|nr:hypothetical protein [Temperatibacter marinus]WND01743.1 hypothetical protein QGN29_09275 [Temperatibacter marinus]